MSTTKTIQIKDKTIGIKKACVEYYESAQDVVNDCKNRETRFREYDMKAKSDAGNFKIDFHHVKNYDEALDLLRNGYQPTVDELKESLKSNKCGEQKRISFKNDVYGFAPIVPLALKGIPNSMINQTMKTIKCKVVDVYYDMGVNCGVCAEDIVKAGQKLLSAIINLEKQGFKFNLYAVQSFNSEETSDVLCVKVKSSNQSIDIKRISFPLTHPAFFRVIGFDWQGRSPITTYRGCGRGRAITTEISETQLSKFAKEVFGKNAIYFSCDSIRRKDKKHIEEVLLNAEKN